jgi:hypothetical protein
MDKPGMQTRTSAFLLSMHGHEPWRESLSKEREIPKSRVDAGKSLTLTANNQIIVAIE